MYMTQFQHVLCIVLLEDLLLRYVITSWQSSWLPLFLILSMGKSKP